MIREFIREKINFEKLREFIREKINFEKLGYFIGRKISSINRFVKKNSPPGMDLKMEKFMFIFGIIIAVAFSLSFFGNYVRELDTLYYWEESDKEILMQGKRVLREGAMMIDFVYVLDSSFVMFVFLGFLMLGNFVVRAAYFWQGSKSIYLMRRLPRKSELYKMIWLMPMMYSILCAAAAVVMLMIYFAVYMTFTPEQCIAPGQWEILWGYIL